MSQCWGAILIGGTAIRRVSKPLQQLERVASRITADLENAETKGAYKPSPPVLDGLKHIRSHDEVGLLASSFVQLGTKLNLTIASLQRSAEAVRLQAAALQREVVERKRAEESFRYQAYYDALTGLPNRTLLQGRFTKALASARRRKDKVALLFLDLDRFKDIDDSLGHSVGDLVRKEVEHLKKWAREQDTVARVGGDEFLIV